MVNTEGQNVMVQGRIVWGSGDLFKGRVKTDQRTKQPRLNEKGEQMIEYGFGLAVPKSSLANVDGNIWKVMNDQAALLFPNRVYPPAFAWKYKDGDTGVTKEGVALNTREGYPGCLVLACTTSWPIKFYRYENGQHFQVNEGIKVGDYVEVQLNVKVHPSINNGDPGLYQNPMAVRFLGYGKEIISAPSPDQIFTAAPQMPQGASATPVSSAPAGMIVPSGMPPAAQGGYPPQQQQGYPPQGAPALVAAPPNYNVLPQIHQPQHQQGYPPQGAPSQMPMPPAAQGGYPPQQQQGYPPQGAPAPAGLPYPPR